MDIISLAIVIVYIIEVLAKYGYVMIFIFMFLESAYIPIPSEVIMPFSGYLAYIGSLNFFYALIIGVMGNLFGSIFGYYVAYTIGEDKLISLGRYIFINKKEIEKAKKYFQKYGNVTIFFSRILPAIRTYIALPAGIYKVNIYYYASLTFAGSLIWCAILEYIGYRLGSSWDLILYSPLHTLLLIVALIFVIAIVYKIYKEN
jgi:membrane protein DedA with SNARE-associated domain